MQQTIVTEENIYKSNKNIRFDLLTVRKAFPVDKALLETRNLNPGDVVTLSEISYIHFHADGDIEVTIKNKENSITYSTSLFTTSNEKSFDSITVKNTSENAVSLYLLSNASGQQYSYEEPAIPNDENVENSSNDENNTESNNSSNTNIINGVVVPKPSKAFNYIQIVNQLDEGYIKWDSSFNDTQTQAYINYMAGLNAIKYINSRLIAEKEFSYFKSYSNTSTFTSDIKNYRLSSGTNFNSTTSNGLLIATTGSSSATESVYVNSRSYDIMFGFLYALKKNALEKNTINSSLQVYIGKFNNNYNNKFLYGDNYLEIPYEVTNASYRLCNTYKNDPTSLPVEFQERLLKENEIYIHNYGYNSVDMRYYKIWWTEHTDDYRYWEKYGVWY